MNDILINTLQTPCFLLDEEEMRLEISEYYKALCRKFKYNYVGYSVKTNSLPYAISKAKEYGCYAEVVSDDELELALECGYDLKHIIFNGPMKSKSRFIEAICGGAVVNIETHREIEWLKDLPTDGLYNVGIRLSINISDISPEDADNENDFSRFGFNDSIDEFSNAIAAIRSTPQVRLAGLHIHRTSHTRSVRFYRNSVSYAAKIIKKYDLQLDYLDVGGGYWGIYPGKPTYEEYATAFYDSLQEQGLENLAIIVEPGSAMLAPSFSYWTKVIDVKKLPDCRILTTDGSRTNIDPLYHKTAYMKEIFRKKNNGEVIPLQFVTGATCLEFDKLFAIENEEELNVGDIIRYDKVGAYTMTLAPMFINFLPRVYSIGSDGIKMVRDKWTAKEQLIKSVFLSNLSAHSNLYDRK